MFPKLHATRLLGLLIAIIFTLLILRPTPTTFSVRTGTDGPTSSASGHAHTSAGHNHATHDLAANPPTNPPVNPPVTVPTASTTKDERAQQLIDAIDRSQSRTLKEAVARYQLLHGRNPPRNYDKWFAYAKEKKCMIDNYAILYENLAPFFEMSPAEFRRRTSLLSSTGARRTYPVIVKDGALQQKDFPYWSQAWVSFITKHQADIGNLELVLNELDEPRVVFDHLAARRLGRKMGELQEVKWHSPAPAEHYSWLLERCAFRQYPDGPIINGIHGFTVNPDTKVYTEQLVPILSNTKLRNCFSDILIPSNYYLFDAFKGEFKDSIPWSEKTPKLFWRGSTTGGTPVDEKYVNYHRHRMVKLAQNNSHMDMGFIGAIQCGAYCEDVKTKYRFADRSPFDDNFKYKYLIDIDGNTFSQRYSPFMQSNSLVFKMTIFQEYFDGWLEPFVHYIPINVDLSDLSEKLQWAIDHDEEAEQIALNSKYFSKRFLTLDQMDCYMYLMFLELARLYSGEELVLPAAH
ncbi:glycosyl transferase family 90-domain-containing protein [Polychytrium aggregatum]|uniref:glycosyl transferase family 90-domain-containing protein n=1 Tax=Polychytrium aggregatum TaxID=110093 RepID=UPI0022FDE70D|nr:glycosyl transferase family 90-domain-containing protein [Polychytrium aggregatum]KAI9206142.1 glycosyl transferase family 90-domain-containing protein [Polychytrium aggregatum]